MFRVVCCYYETYAQTIWPKFPIPIKHAIDEEIKIKNEGHYKQLEILVQKSTS